ncbi:cytochrome P450, putative [Talaromyces stipitatus ATCC 10500]|uniref:Cytochrome P450, putative n=1 Tax=Talaromyces stipitatus (strain ATCC 10500 / CBS 375.48 / QM 6759 / NRRL 1006) TaxID=441959 RepID=B8MIY3_TALSN|nr:cytochrome P450, putative [Talaromyces stipitatus ATCC 10500]EED15645.1 cytochrome P450, putative [Talaromyces stipitatus ATCC 10500]
MALLISSFPGLSSAATGVALHHLLFRQGEWDSSAPTLLSSYVVIFAGLNVLKLGAPEFQNLNTYYVLACHLLGLFSSIIVYRMLFHRLRKFPGPVLAGITSWYANCLSAKKLHKFEEIGRLHRQYGDYVRVGPRELSIANPRALPIIYGHASQTTKGPFYDGAKPYISVHSTRDKRDHARRRKMWDRAFSSKSLRDYEQRVSRYAAQLLSVIADNVGKPIDMSRWFNYYSFDVIGDLIFGKSFDMLITGKDAYMLKTLHKDMQSMGPFLHSMWILEIFKLIPGLNSSLLVYFEWVKEQIENRMKNEPENPDIFTQLEADFRNTKQSKKDQLHFHGEVNVGLVAGSDSTASTLTNLFYELANAPEFTCLLQAEIDSVKERTYQELSQMQLLNAAIDETMRLHPAIPSGMQRLTSQKGVMIDDVYIPGNCLVQIPLYSIFRDERSFAQPNEFIPQRWTDRPDLVKDPSAYAPFGLGPFACAGRQLAYMEIRRITTELLSRYDISLAKDQTREAFYEGQRDSFTVVCGKLQLEFTERGTVKV